MVSQAKLKESQEASNGQFKFITLQMGMPVPYRIYTEISKESAIWSVKNGLNAKSVNDSERYSSNIVNKGQNSRLNLLTGMEEYVVDDSAF